MALSEVVKGLVSDEEMFGEQLVDTRLGPSLLLDSFLKDFSMRVWKRDHELHLPQASTCRGHPASHDRKKRAHGHMRGTSR